jgi:hypothetical protein
MFVASRCMFVPAAVVASITMAGALSAASAAGLSAQATPQRAGTAAIAHTTSRDDATLLTHVQQQLIRLVGVPEARPADIETLVRALEAARARPLPAGRITALAEALSAALAQGTFEETTIQRLAEDLFAALNNKKLTSEQAALLAVDVSAALQEVGALEPRIAVVLTALQGVCPDAVLPTDAGAPGKPGDHTQTPAKRSLLTLSRDSSSDD